jgi:4-diphosphocytidyl-2-C-methyl-D-erythritol kinase
LKTLSPAKINLHLRVGPPGADGFHPLLSWMCTVGLYDTIEFWNSDTPGVRLTCDRPDVPVDDTNLIVRAGKMLESTRGAEVVLSKKIPMGGGLGGGSSNAAFALRSFNQIWNLRRSDADLSQIAAQLGSDIVFFLHGPSSVCAGRGERVTPISAPAVKFVVLIFPKMSMPTPAVYRRFDEMGLGSDDAMTHEPDWNAWTKAPAKLLLPKLVNDLEAPAFSLRPELGDLRNQIECKIGRVTRMSGSGSSLFTLADDAGEAQWLAKAIRAGGIDAAAFELAPKPVP